MQSRRPALPFIERCSDAAEPPALWFGRRMNPPQRRPRAGVIDGPGAQYVSPEPTPQCANTRPVRWKQRVNPASTTTMSRCRRRADPTHPRGTPIRYQSVRHYARRALSVVGSFGTREVKVEAAHGRARMVFLPYDDGTTMPERRLSTHERRQTVYRKVWCKSVLPIPVLVCRMKFARGCFSHLSRPRRPVWEWACRDYRGRVMALAPLTSIRSIIATTVPVPRSSFRIPRRQMGIACISALPPPRRRRFGMTF